jgi:hypothetical protein
MNMIDVTIIGSVVAGIVFFLMGVPFLTGTLLRFLLKGPPARRVALVGAVLVFVAQLPGSLAFGNGPLDDSLSRHLTDKTSIAAAQTAETAIWLVVGIGFPFIFATWGTELTDRLRKRNRGPNQASESAFFGASEK